MTMDLSSIESGVFSIAGAVIVACVPIAVNALLARLKMDKDTDLKSKLDSLATQAAGAAYTMVINTAPHLVNVSTHSQAIDSAVSMFLGMAQPYLDSLNRNKDQFAAKVAGEFGQLLGKDPSVSLPPVVPTPTVLNQQGEPVASVGSGSSISSYAPSISAPAPTVPPAPQPSSPPTEGVATAIAPRPSALPIPVSSVGS